jgi:hypothetical protein
MRRAALPFLFCLGGLILAHHEMILTGFGAMQTDVGDTRFNNYIAEHEYRWLLGEDGHRDFWSPPFFFPARNVAGYSEVMIGAAPLYWPWRAIGLAPDSAYQAWMLTLSGLNFFAMYVLLRRGFLQPTLGAAVGAVMFAFSAPRVNQLSHLQLIPHFWSLLCLYALLRVFAPARPLSDAQQRAWIWIIFVAAALQVLASFALGWFLGLALAIAGVGALLSPGGRRSLWTLVRSRRYTVLAAATAAAIVLAPVTMHFYSASRLVGLRTFENAQDFMPTPASWVYMGSSSWLYGWTSDWSWFQDLPGEWEQRLGPGLLTTILALTGLWTARRDVRVRYVALVGACLIVLSTSVGGVTAWRLVYDYFPAAKAVRGVCRAGLLVLIPVALGVSLALTSVAASGRRGAAIAVVLAILAVVEQGQTTETFEKRANREDIADVVRHIDTDRCGSFVFSPVQGNEPPWQKYQLDAMWAGMDAGVPTLNGYSGNQPPGWQLADTSLYSDTPDPTMAGAIDDWVERNGLDPSRVCWLRLPVRNDGYWASFVAQSVPRSMVAGGRYQVEVTFRNVGGVVWSRRKGFRLGSQVPQDTDRWGTNRVKAQRGAIGRDGLAVFTFEVTAPSDPGVYPFQWRMIQEDVRWFGELTAPLQITVTTPPASAAARDYSTGR